MEKFLEPKEARRIIYRKLTEAIVRLPRKEAIALDKYIRLLYEIDSCCIGREESFYENIDYLGETK